MTLKEQKQKAVWIALHGTNKELEAHIEEVAITADKRERESTRPEKFNIPRIIKRGQIKSRFKITREESIYGYDLWRGHYVELGRSQWGS